MAGAAVSVEGLSQRYPGRRARGGNPGAGSSDVVVLDGLGLEVRASGYAAVTGTSGAGKSTLLSILGGLEPHQQGTVTVDGTELGELSRDQLAQYRRETVGFVFQHFGLLDALTAAENVALAPTLTGAGRRASRRRAHELLDAVGLGSRCDHLPTTLSGGERQRVAIARALANGPRLVLADEPTGNLDDDSTQVVVGLLESLPAEHGCTLLVVTHDQRLAARAEQAWVLAEGRLAPRTAVQP